MAAERKQNFLSGAAVLAGTVVLVKIIGAIYKIPLFNLLGDDGSAYFNVAYQVYNLLLSIATAGIPAAISRLVSASLAGGGREQVRRYLRVGLCLFSVVGALGCLAMLVFPAFFATLAGDAEIAHCIMVLAPAVLFSCVIAVYRGYTQGHSNMIPTAISQVLEVLGKLSIGLSVAWLLMRRAAALYDIAAGAIAGVTVGLGVAIPVLAVYCRKHYRYAPEHTGIEEALMTPGQTAIQMLRVSVPITLASSLASVLSVVDTKVLYRQLQSGVGLTMTQARVLNGVYAKGLTFFNLPSAIIVPISVSIIPAISAALAQRKRDEAKKIMESSMRVTNLIAMPACMGMAVLAQPIFRVFFPESNEMGPVLLQILCPAAYFLCTELVTTGFLQASGHERMLLVTSLSGSLIKIILDWFLIADPRVSIMGAPISNVVCYGYITCLNFFILHRKMKERLRFSAMYLRPLLCTLCMGGAAWAVYGITSRLLLSLGMGERMQALGGMGCSVIAAVIVYLVLVLATRAMTREDMLLLPKGEKLADLLHMPKTVKHGK